MNDLSLDASIKVITHGKPNPVIATVVEPVEEVIGSLLLPAADAKGKKKK